MNPFSVLMKYASVKYSVVCACVFACICPAVCLLKTTQWRGCTGSIMLRLFCSSSGGGCTLIGRTTLKSVTSPTRWTSGCYYTFIKLGYMTLNTIEQLKTDFLRYFSCRDLIGSNIVSASAKLLLLVLKKCVLWWLRGLSHLTLVNTACSSSDRELGSMSFPTSVNSQGQPETHLLSSLCVLIWQSSSIAFLQPFWHTCLTSWSASLKHNRLCCLPSLYDSDYLSHSESQNFSSCFPWNVSGNHLIHDMHWGFFFIFNHLLNLFVCLFFYR